MTTRTSRIRLLLAAAATAATALGTAALPASPASAAASASLSTTLSASPSTLVGSVRHLTVDVVNNGTAPTQAPWTIAVQLPASNSYGPMNTRVLVGSFGALPPGCALNSSIKLVCSMPTPLSNVPGANTTSIGFDVTLPYITKPFTFVASAATANNDGMGSGTAVLPLVQTFHTVTAPLGQANLSYCGGAGLDGTGLTSYFECTTVPGRTLAYKMTLAPGGQLTNFLMNNKLVSTRGGTWAINGTQLDLVLTSGTTQLGTMSLQGVSSRCWEGPLATMNGGVPAPNPAQYQVCL